VVQTIETLIGTDWTDQDGVLRPLTIDDFMVVAPYAAESTPHSPPAG